MKLSLPNFFYKRFPPLYTFLLVILKSFLGQFQKLRSQRQCSRIRMHHQLRGILKVSGHHCLLNLIAAVVDHVEYPAPAAAAAAVVVQVKGVLLHHPPPKRAKCSCLCLRKTKHVIAYHGLGLPGSSPPPYPVTNTAEEEKSKPEKLPSNEENNDSATQNEEMQALISLAPPSPPDTSLLETTGEVRSLLYTPKQDDTLSDVSANEV